MNTAKKCVLITAIFTFSSISAFRELLVCRFWFGLTQHEGESREGRTLLATVIILSSEMKCRRREKRERAGKGAQGLIPISRHVTPHLCDDRKNHVPSRFQKSSWIAWWWISKLEKKTTQSSLFIPLVLSRHGHTNSIYLDPFDCWRQRLRRTTGIRRANNKKRKEKTEAGPQATEPRPVRLGTVQIVQSSVII